MKARLYCRDGEIKNFDISAVDQTLTMPREWTMVEPLRRAADEGQKFELIGLFEDVAIYVEE